MKSIFRDILHAVLVVTVNIVVTHCSNIKYISHIEHKNQHGVSEFGFGRKEKVN